MNLSIKEFYDEKSRIKEVIDKMTSTQVNEANFSKMSSIFDKIGNKCSGLFNNVDTFSKNNLSKIDRDEIKKFSIEFRNDAHQLQAYKSYLSSVRDKTVTNTQVKKLELNNNNQTN